MNFENMFRIFKKKSNPVLEKYFDYIQIDKIVKSPRYTPLETSIFGKRIYVNDACTLVGDVIGILDKEVYSFNTKNPRPLIIDCGANIGISVLFFKRLYKNAKILAYEPDPTLFMLLEKNIFSFGLERVELEQKAIWLDSKGVHFKTEGGHSGTVADENDGAKSIVRVPSVRLRDVLNDFDEIDMLKMDIEGAENEVLFDCKSELGKCDHIFIEYHSAVNKKQRLHEILNLFYELGYRYHIQEAFVRKKPFVDTNCLVGMDLQLNLFFTRI